MLGETDAGKTSLVRDLANSFLARGLRVAVVDADLGQSEIGPPTTIGVGRVRRPLTRLGDLDPDALRFIGVTSAAREPLATVVGTKKLVERALDLDVDRVVVDTSGLVRGELGLRLKQAKIDVLAPDVIVALQRDGECEPILRPYGRDPRLRIVRGAAATGVRRRTAEDRRRHRDRGLAAHLSGARSVVVDLARVLLRAPALLAGTPLGSEERAEAANVVGQEVLWGERRGGEVAIVTPLALDESAVRAVSRRLHAAPVVHHAMADLVGMLAGLDDEARETLGLGIVTAIDLAGGLVTLTTAVDPARVAVMTIGRERYRGGLPSPAAAGSTSP